jgi:hypothetical protein
MPEKSTLVSLLLIFALLAAARPSNAGCRVCQTHEKDIDLSVRNDAPDKLKGPHEIVLKNVNRLRYEVTIGDAISFSNGPDLSIAQFVFTPKAPAKAANGNKMAAESATQPAAEGLKILDKTMQTQSKAMAEKLRLVKDPYQDVIDQTETIRRSLQSAAMEVANALDAADDAEQSLQDLNNQVLDLVGNSDQVLAQENGTGSLISEAETVKKALAAGLPSWPVESVRAARAAIAAAKSETEKLLTLPAFTTWVHDADNYKTYTSLQDAADQLGKQLDAIAPGSKRLTDFKTLATKLQGWKTRIDNLNQDSFTVKITAECGHPFLENKTTDYQVTLRDRLEPDDKKATKTIKLATVECPSAVTVTGGVGLSGLDQRDFKLIATPKGDKTVNTIGFDSRGSQQVNPLVLINTRLTDCQGYNLHASAGTVFDLNNSTSSVAIGYLIGLSVSLRDSLFLTVGAQLGRGYKLADSYYVGQEVPQGVTAPPVERKWTTSWGVAATFKIR